MRADNLPETDAIRSQLDRILQSTDFRASDKQRSFLSFVVDEALAGRSSQLKGYTIAVSVYGRPSDHWHSPSLQVAPGSQSPSSTQDVGQLGGSWSASPEQNTDG